MNNHASVLQRHFREFSVAAVLGLLLLLLAIVAPGFFAHQNTPLENSSSSWPNDW